MNTPGWYPNPDGTNTQRYWSGQEWTAEVRSAPAAPPPPPMFDPAMPAAAAPGGYGGYGAYSTAGAGGPGTVTAAGAGSRIVARIIDAIILVFGLGIVAVALFSGSMMATAPGAAPGAGLELTAAVVLGGLGAAYEIVQIALWGQTPGKRLMGVKVVDADTGDLPGWGGASIRWAVPSLVSWIPFVGGLAGTVIVVVSLVLLFTDPFGQVVWDKAAKTRVVRA